MREEFIIEKAFGGGYDLIKKSTDFYDCTEVQFDYIKTFKTKAKAEKVAKLLNE